MTARRPLASRPIACLLALTFAATLPLAAQRGPGGSYPSSVAISPDGTTLAWTLHTREGSTLRLTDVANPDPAKEKIVTPNGATNCSSSDPIWSPDSQTLAFTSTCTSKEPAPGQEQIFLYARATGETHQLTHLTGDFDQATWSPDGKTIAFLFVENATRSAGALDAMKPWSGVIGEDGVEIQRVAYVDVTSGNAFWITPPDLHVFEFAFAPTLQGKIPVAYIASNPPGENSWWIAKLYGKDNYVGECSALKDTRPVPAGQVGGISASGCGLAVQPKVLLDPTTIPGALHGLQIAVPRYSPDGKHIAFIGGLMSDQGSTGGDVWVIDSKGGQPTDVTPDIDGTPTFEAWTGNDSLGFVEDRRGHTLLTDYTVSTRKQDSTVDLGEAVLFGGPIKNAVSVSNRGLIAFAKTGYNAPPELFIMNGGTNALTQITHLNDGTKPSTTRFESIEWTNPVSASDPTLFHVQGWLTYPVDYKPGKKYPLIVEVHGGPSASAGPRPDTQFSNLGYFVLAPNPRGSFGQGEAFVKANIKDFGYGDLRDILAGVDAVEKKVSIDDHRLGLTGWSYGGFMSMFAETQTNRFRAIVAGAGISNWQSYYGENSIDQWMVPFFGATVYDDPAIYAKSSAITYIHNAKTPMLIIVGDRDGECPAPQSFEMWHALKAEGIKTQLVIYPNEGHGFRDPAHIKDRAERTAKWFAENMPEK